MNNKNTKVVGVILLILVAGISFYGGMAYAKGKTQGAATAGAGQFTGGGAGGAGRIGGRTGGAGGATFGKVIAKDATSITLQIAAGGSKTVFITPSTPVSKDTAGTLADVAIGTQVSITGAANSDGSVTAQSIRIGGMMGRGMASTTPTTSAQ